MIEPHPRMTYSYLRNALVLLGVALLWNAFLWPIAYFVMPAKHPLVIKIILGGFLLIGPFLLWGGLRALVRGMRYRTSHFLPDRIPVRPGETLTGRLAWPRMPPGNVHVSLVCTMTRGEGRDVLWREDREISALSIMHGESEASFPIAFALPYEMPSSGSKSSDTECTWILRAGIGGTKEVPAYSSQFTIPVTERR